MADSKKPSTADILNLLRKQGAGDAPGKPADAPAEQPPAAEPAAEAPPEPKPFREPLPSEVAKPAVKPAGKPSDIMAAIRGGGGGAAAAPKADAPAKPSSSADILAAARAKAPAAGGDKPKSPADILAAARGGVGAPKAAAAPKEGVAKPAATAKAAADVSGRDPKELVQALRTGKSGIAVAEAPKKPKLPAPKLPSTAAGPAVPRRNFAAAFLEAMMAPFVIGWSVFAFIIGLSTLLTARFMMPNTVLELPSRFKIGPASDFPPESVSEKFKAARGVWVVNTAGYNGEQMIYALASVCTHLGCTPNWLEGEQKFKCPCHGSGFYITGINFEGPAPRPLERVGISVAADGMLEVDKSMKFQEELGQWVDGKSYHAV